MAIDREYFKDLTKEDQAEYYPKVWKKVASRVIILSKHELKDNDIFKNLSEEAIKFFTLLCDIKCYGDESVDMSSGGIVLNGRGFLPEEGPHDDPGPTLRYIAPGSGSYKYVELPAATKNMIIMHFPTTDLIDMSAKQLSEDEIR